jgi:hypothetical protein
MAMKRKRKVQSCSAVAAAAKCIRVDVVESGFFWQKCDLTHFTPTTSYSFVGGFRRKSQTDAGNAQAIVNYLGNNELPRH